MKKDLIVKAITIPLAIGVILGIAFFLYSLMSNSNVPTPIENSEVVYFDDSENEDVGTMSVDNANFSIIKNADYSKMATCVSFVDGVSAGDIGVGYYEVFDNNIKNENQKEITISNDSGAYNYKLVSTFETKNRNDIFLKDVDLSSGIVLFYQISDDYGYSSDYEVLVFEEVG